MKQRIGSLSLWLTPRRIQFQEGGHVLPPLLPLSSLCFVSVIEVHTLHSISNQCVFENFSVIVLVHLCLWAPDNVTLCDRSLATSDNVTFTFVECRHLSAFSLSLSGCGRVTVYVHTYIFFSNHIPSTDMQSSVCSHLWCGASMQGEALHIHSTFVE